MCIVRLKPEAVHTNDIVTFPQQCSISICLVKRLELYFRTSLRRFKINNKGGVTMRHISRQTSLFVSLITVAFAAVITTAPAYAQNTTSSIRVQVSDESGARIGGVRISVTHLPTGRSQTVTADGQGVATLRGLAVGGPYEISIPASANYTAHKVEDIVLKLDETEVVPLALQASTIEEITVP